MNIESRHIGLGKSTSILLTVNDWSGNSSITEDVTDLRGHVDEEFIMALRNIADELEEQNNNIAESE
jgi:hypothetical protein